MTMIQRKQKVNYLPAEMYRLVDDVENYQLFLPWCKESKILSRTADEVRATLILSAGGFYKTFTTCNRLQKDKMIEISLIDGPFRRLEGFWLFHPEDESCIVQFELEFEFSTKLLGMAFSPVFNQVANTLVDSFVKRANELYGQR
jgi:ribosome-associated toxin RatA of RatAB toxin-antitoxin module